MTAAAPPTPVYPRRRRRDEAISVGFDDFLSTLGVLPFSTGLRVPPLFGPTYRFLCAVVDLTTGDRLTGLRQFWSIADYIATGGGAEPPPAPVYAEVRPVVTPGWRFADIGAPIWTLTFQGLSNFNRVAQGPFDQESFLQFDTTGPALVYESAAFPVLPPLPGYLGLSAYTPPPMRGNTVELYRDIRFPQQQNEFFAFDYAFRNPTRVRLYCDIQQHNPQNTPPIIAQNPAQPSLFFACGVVPEEQFLQLFPAAVVHAVGGALLYDER